MSEGNLSLRQLARAYASGQLNLADYRKARDILIENILSGDAQAAEPEARGGVQPPVDNESTERGQGQRITTTEPTFRSQQSHSQSEPPPQPDRSPSDPSSIKGPLIIAGLGGLVFLVAVIYLLLSPSAVDDAVPQPGTKAGADSGPVAAEPATRNLILSFLRDGSWSQASMDEFLNAWRSLSEPERNSAQGSVELSRLTNTILKQMLAERALSGLAGNSDALEKQRMLAEFARALGIDDPRLTIPEDNADEDADPAGSDEQAVNSDRPDTSCAPYQAGDPTAYCRDALHSRTDYGPTMVVIPPGSYVMGGNREQEQPHHRVQIDYSFALSVHEVTYGEYSQFCRRTSRNCPSQPWFGADYPVVNISWHQANAYARWLSENTGQHYRLASEAEWEYAARADGRQLQGTSAVPNAGSILQGPLPKTDRSVSRNAFHIYHMLGNVREWTRDHWHDDYQAAPADGSAWISGQSDYRVVRGGSYAEQVTDLRADARIRLPVDHADRYTGFRVVQELENG